MGITRRSHSVRVDWSVAVALALGLQAAACVIDPDDPPAPQQGTGGSATGQAGAGAPGTAGSGPGPGGATGAAGMSGGGGIAPPFADPRIGVADDNPNKVVPGPGPGDQHLDFPVVLARGQAIRPTAATRQEALLGARYDLSNNPSDVLMTRGKPVQQGARAKLPAGHDWQTLGELTPSQIRAGDLFPTGFLPLPHPNQAEGGMLFPQPTIDEIKRQTGRDLQRFDLDFDLPSHLLPEFPPAIFLTTRPDLGDVSRGQVLTTSNFFELFKSILNPKQLDGLRLLLTPFPQQQFNLTDDRRSVLPSQGVSCLDCHVNGHTNAATHLVQDIRPQEMRSRVDTPTLRGLNIQRLFGSQRALKTVEDFTEFEQRGAYFDGDMASAQKKGINILDRGQEVHPMAEFQQLLDFPPAPKLDLFGKLDPMQATPAELRGELVFNGKAKCGACHPAPYFTDNTMHDLAVDRFFAPRMINGLMTKPDGPIKTFPLRGIKESPPYFHDGRLLTLEDTVEFFNLILQVQLSAEEKSDLLAFMRTL